jgi:hypothetical protein
MLIPKQIPSLVALFSSAFPLGSKSFDLFAALSGACFPSNPIHRNGQRFMRFRAQCAMRHRAGRKPLPNLA